MSPRYEPDLTKVAATIEIFSKGDYEFSIGEPKSFSSPKDDGTATVGIRFPLKVEEVYDGGDEKAKGKRTILTVYVHNEGGQSMAKQFIMCALGYKRNPQDERKFDEKYSGSDWGLDPDSKSVGDVWREPVGRRVRSSLDIGIQEKGQNAGEPQQKFANWQPVGAAA